MILNNLTSINRCSDVMSIPAVSSESVHTVLAVLVSVFVVCFKVEPNAYFYLIS